MHELGRRLGAEPNVYSVAAELRLEVACDPAEFVAAGRPQDQVDLAAEFVLTLDECHPMAAFGNMRRAVKPGGRLTLLVFRTAKENLWPQGPLEAVRHLLPPTRSVDLVHDEVGKPLIANRYAKGFEYSDCFVDDARLVVLGSSSRTDLPRMPLGSVAARLLHMATRPVLIVPRPDTAS